MKFVLSEESAIFQYQPVHLMLFLVAVMSIYTSFSVTLILRVRACIDVIDEKILTVRELPFGVTTESLIQSVQDAVNKGKFKLCLGN